MPYYFRTMPNFVLRVVKTSSADLRPKFLSSCNFSGEYSSKSPIVFICARFKQLYARTDNCNSSIAIFVWGSIGLLISFFSSSFVP